MNDINTALADEATTTYVRGQVLNPGRLVLLQPDETIQEGSQWQMLTQGGDILTLDASTHELTGDRLQDDELVARLIQLRISTTYRLTVSEESNRELRDSIASMRDYAINAHRQGHFCRSGLNEALAHFGLDLYERYSVPVTIRATFEINAETAQDAASRVRYVIDGIEFSGATENEEIEVSTDEIEVHDPDEV